MKKSKVLLLMLCTAALSVGVTFGTLAYLTDKDADVNTFTVGQVHILLDEQDVDKDTDTNDEDITPNSNPQRDKANVYHLIPGERYVKDPIVHIQEGSEGCWVFVKVENGIVGIESDVVADDPNTTAVNEAYSPIANQIAANGWTALDGVTNVFYKKWEKDASDRDLEVFQEFKIDGTKATNDSILNYETATKGTAVNVTAYAIQSTGFDTANAAWTAGNFQ